MKNDHPKFWSTPTGWAALAFIAAATYFLVFEHGQHVLQLLPYSILLLCVFMHTFMHGSHGKHDHSHASDAKKEESFQEFTDKNDAYRDGYTQGLEEGRKESHKKENCNE